MRLDSNVQNHVNLMLVLRFIDIVVAAQLVYSGIENCEKRSILNLGDSNRKIGNRQLMSTYGFGFEIYSTASIVTVVIGLGKYFRMNATKCQRK